MTSSTYALLLSRSTLIKVLFSWRVLFLKSNGKTEIKVKKNKSPHNMFWKNIQLKTIREQSLEWASNFFCSTSTHWALEFLHCFHSVPQGCFLSGLTVFQEMSSGLLKMLFQRCIKQVCWIFFYYFFLTKSGKFRSTLGHSFKQNVRCKTYDRARLMGGERTCNLSQLRAAIFYATSFSF